MSWGCSLLLGIETAEQPIMVALAGSSGIVLVSFFAIAVIVAPVGEEMFFRGHLFRWSQSRCGITYAYVLTAVFFAVIHGNPPGIPSYVVAALAMGWAYERWRILTIPMVAHATFNAIAVGYMVYT